MAASTSESVRSRRHKDSDEMSALLGSKRGSPARRVPSELRRQGDDQNGERHPRLDLEIQSDEAVHDQGDEGRDFGSSGDLGFGSCGVYQRCRKRFQPSDTAIYGGVGQQVNYYILRLQIYPTFT